MLSTGVIGARLPLDKLLPGLARAAAALSADGGARRGRGDHDHRHARRRRRSSPRDGFIVGGMAKGSGMIHPDLATMLAVRHDRLPARAGRGRRACSGRRSSESFNAISVDGEPSTNDAVILLANGASGVARTPATDAAFARRARARRARDLARQIVADGEGDHRARGDHGHRRRRRRAGEGDRAPDRDLAARQDRALRPRRELGPRARGRRLGAVERRLRGRSTPTASRSRYNGTVVLDRGAPLERRAGRLRAELHDRARPRPRRRARPAT